MSQYTKAILDKSIEYSQDLLLDYLNQLEVSQDLSIAFGDTFDREAGISLLRSLNESDPEGLPQIEIRSATELNNAKAAYSFNTNTIYFSEEFILTNANDPAKIARVYLEEIGHYLDFEANITDAPGDEGAIFSSLITGEELSAEILSTLQAEDDTATVNLDGTEITVEQANAIIYVNANATGANNGTSWANAYTDLQDAIAVSEATDQIWTAAGTYQPTTRTNRNASFVLPEGVRLYGGFAGSETSLEQRDVEANVTELSGDIGTQGDNTDNSYVVVDLSEALGSILDGFSITDANNDRSTNSIGGGILSRGGSATLANLTISDNIAGDGAGIAANSSELEISNVVLSNNSVTRDGGGYYSRNGNSTLSNVTFIGNSAGEQGGAIYYNNSNDAFTNIEFSSNRAEFGGAVFNRSSDLDLSGSSFFNNSATEDGGAIFNSSNGNPNLTSVNFVSNTATEDGGAIFNDGGSPVIIGAVFADNIANSSGGAFYSSGNHTVANSLFTGNVSFFGGAIFSLDNSSTVVNSTFSDNTGRSSGAIAFSGDENDTPSVINSIIYDNRSFASDNQIVAGETSLNVSNSLIQDAINAGGNLNVNPEFVAPDSFDYRLSEGSPAIDAGNNQATVLAGEDADIELGEDLAGNARIVGTRVDLGAYEGAALEPVPTRPTIASESNIVYVNLAATGENDGSSWANAYTDLQAALQDAPFGTQIWVAAGTYTPTEEADRRDLSFVLADGVQLYGGFAGDETNLSQRDVTTNPTILSGDIGTAGDNSDNSSRVVLLDDTSSSSILDGFTVRDGNADVAELGTDGAGISGERSQAILRNLIVTNNTATGLGGGMYVQDSLNQLTNVDFVSNTANSGGAMYNNNSGSILTDTTFEGNSSENSGGAILNEASSIIIDEAVFTNNIAGGSGGAVFNADLSNSVINDVLFEGNSALNSGGGAVFNFESSPVLTNVEFRSNSATATGGAIYNLGEETGTAIANGIFEGNSAEFGGAIYSSFGSSRGVNLTFANNVATLNGGAIYTAGDEDTISTYTNTIIWNNSQSEDIEPIFNDGTEAVISQSIVEGGYEAGTDIIDADPLFVDGEAVDFRLSADSPAIDAGTLDPVFLETDLAGFDRVFGEGVDLGAYEYFNPAEVAPTVFRFFRPDIGVHFYTSDVVERDSVLENLPAFEFEGPSFIAAPTPEEGEDPLTGVEPVYRFLNNNTGVHVYTISEVEREAILELPNFTDEGIAYYSYETEQLGTTPLYRFYNPVIGAHFYTPNAAERDFVSESLTNYQPEGENGVAYHVLPLGDTAMADM